MLQVCLKGSEKQKSWYLDSGCSRHMIGEMSLFLTLTMKEGGTVGFGGNQTNKIIGTGTIVWMYMLHLEQQSLSEEI